MENKTLELEMKLCYLEDYITQMNEIVISQGKKIDRLIDINKQLGEKVSVLEENIKEPADNTPPPHY